MERGYKGNHQEGVQEVKTLRRKTNRKTSPRRMLLPHTHTHTHVNTHTHMHAHTHTRTPTRTHARTHTCIYTHTHTPQKEDAPERLTFHSCCFNEPWSSEHKEQQAQPRGKLLNTSPPSLCSVCGCGCVWVCVWVLIWKVCEGIILVIFDTADIQFITNPNVWLQFLCFNHFLHLAQIQIADT